VGTTGQYYTVECDVLPEKPPASFNVMLGYSTADPPACAEGKKAFAGKLTEVEFKFREVAKSKKVNLTPVGLLGKTPTALSISLNWTHARLTSQ